MVDDACVEPDVVGDTEGENHTRPVYADRTKRPSSRTGGLAIQFDAVIEFLSGHLPEKEF
jgi:hypothetical protein